MAHSERGAHYGLFQMLGSTFQHETTERIRFVRRSRQQADEIYRRAYKDVLYGGVIEVHSHEKAEGEK